MNLTFVVMGTLTILVAFGVFESFLKICGLNRFLTCIFLLIGTVFSLLGTVNILGYEISFNLFNYFVAFVILMTKIKNVKSFVSAIICCMVIIVAFSCYNAVNLSEFEYDFVQPYVYMSLVIGIIFSLFSNNIGSVFCGTFVGGIIYELIASKMFAVSIETPLTLGGQMVIQSIIVMCITFVILSEVKSFVTNLKLKKKSKTIN